MRLHIAREPADSMVAAQLMQALSAEQAALYEDEGDSGFHVEDVAGPRGLFVVAWIDGKGIGCGALRPMENDAIAEVKRMYVQPPWRGKGIGRAILVRLEQAAREMGYDEVWLETGVRQPEAIGFYTHSGYARIPCYGEYAEDPDSVCFGKRLQPD